MTDQQKTYRFTLSPSAHAAPYQCLAEDTTSIDIDATRELAHVLIEQYTNTTQTLKKWRKAPQFRIYWTDTSTKPPAKRESNLLRFDWLVDHFKKYRGLEHSRLGLCSPERVRPNWMDTDLTWWGHYAPCNEATESLTLQLPLTFGADFRVTPAIDREGFATTSPQLHLQKGFLRARNRVIQESATFVPQVIDREKDEHAQMIMGGTPPLAALIEFASLYVTIVDITLMQAYYAGFYTPKETGLRFDKNVMGPATGRRVADKLKWIRALSGKPLNASEEMDAFNQIKAVRNHLAHFDPPCLAVSIDDVAGWLSKTSALAWLLIKIRKCLGVPISGPLVQMAMAPPVVAVPRDPAHQRYPQSEDTGYVSSTWKGEHPHRGRDPLRIPEQLLEQLELIRTRASRALGRDCELSEVIEVVLIQRISELNSLSSADFHKLIHNALIIVKKK